MDRQSIELVEFKKVVASFRSALEAPKTDLSRDAAIQRFKFCVELSWKISKKVMGTQATSPKSVVREMGQDGLIDDVEVWLRYIDLRNLTVHTYKESLAEDVYQKCRPFVLELEKLIVKLEARLS
jgi:nucleotidyltransferase substrate binding protein (TIGR01987 family)